jgi:hypothetical protein
MSGIEYDRHSIEGFWEKKIKNEVFIFHIDKRDRSRYRGIIVTYRQGVAVAHMEMGAIEFENLRVEMVTNPNRKITFRGTLDTLRQIITGKMHYNDG